MGEVGNGRGGHAGKVGDRRAKRYVGEMGGVGVGRGGEVRGKWGTGKGDGTWGRRGTWGTGAVRGGVEGRGDGTWGRGDGRGGRSVGEVGEVEDG